MNSLCGMEKVLVVHTSNNRIVRAIVHLNGRPYDSLMPSTIKLIHLDLNRLQEN